MKPNLRTNLGRFLLGAVLLLAAGTVWAQPQNIRGKITDPAGQPVAGASVIVKGTTNGTSAKADGTFELGAAKGATLQITMLGYKTAEKEVTTATFYPITLEDDSKLVDEVVVVGYGAVKKATSPVRWRPSKWGRSTTSPPLRSTDCFRAVPQVFRC